MANYDFKSTSPWKFEQLSRDLLKAARGLSFEVSKEGGDNILLMKRYFSSGVVKTVIILLFEI